MFVFVVANEIVNFFFACIGMFGASPGGRPARLLREVAHSDH